MILITLVASLLPLCFSSVFFEDFERKNLEAVWTYPVDKKYNRFMPSNMYKEARRLRDTNVELKTPKKNSHYGVTAMLEEPFLPSKGIVLQYDTTATEGHSCGGRYLKLLSHDSRFRPEDLSNSTPFSILFGPDKCEPTGQIRLILSHRDPVSGLPIEKHWSPRVPMRDDALPHVYTLVIRTDNNVEIMEDGDIVASGSLFDHLQPPINPPRMIYDPDDIKPSDWVDEEVMAEPSAKQPDNWVTASVIVNTKATKPAGWLDDEPRLIPKKGAKKPRGWDDQEDGEWSPPMIPNPKCEKVGCGKWKRPLMPNPNFKGKWQPPMIKNPNFKGKWIQKMIPNPNAHLVDPQPLANIANISAVAIEIWTIDEGYQWDNFYIGRSVKDAKTLRDERWLLKYLKKKEALDKVNEEAAMKRAKDKEDLERAKRRNNVGYGSPMGLPSLLLAFYESLGPMKPIFKPMADAVRRTPHTAYLLLALPLGLLLFIFIVVSSPKVPQNIDLEESDDENDKKQEEKKVKEAIETKTAIEGSEKKEK